MIFRRSRWEEELKEELQFHIEARADSLGGTGVPREEAIRRAQLEFGHIDRSKEGCREARGGRWIDELSRNLVVAVRSIRKNPGFSLVAALSLALGIGGNLAVFGVLHRLILTELPVRDANQLYEAVVVSAHGVSRGISYAKFQRRPRQLHVLHAAIRLGPIGTLRAGRRPPQRAAPDSCRHRQLL